MATRSPALSASRTKEYLQCPLKFRFQVVDSLPQPPSEAAVKGTVVHEVLEHLFDLPREIRDEAHAQQLLPAAWEKTLNRDEMAAELFEDADRLDIAKADTEELVDSYFRLERPKNLQPRARERFIDVRLSNGILLRGIVDRIDEAADGAIRVIDYKTGRAPSPRFTGDALFQMRFYALMLRESWRLPARMQLLYLRSGQVLTLDPEYRDIERFEGEVGDIWERIKSDALADAFRPKRSKLCDWCAFQELCPAFGGQQPTLPEEGRARLLAIQQNPE